jgi:hypothetical protein
MSSKSKSNAKRPAAKVDMGSTEKIETNAPDPNPIKPVPELNVMIAACGMLRDFEVFRQINEGIVKNFGELKLEGVLLLPDRISAVPDTLIIRKAIEDGLIILIPG